MSDRIRLGSGTDGATNAELEELALARSRALGRPVIVAGFSASGRAQVFDVERDDDDEPRLVPRGIVPVEPSRPLGPLAR